MMKDKVIEQKDKVIEEKELVIEQKALEFECRDSLIKSMIQMLHGQEVDIETIAVQLNLIDDDIRNYLDKG